jgi:hypothetical protein
MFRFQDKNSRKSISLCAWILFFLGTSGIANADCKGGEGVFDIVISSKPAEFYSPGDVVDCTTLGNITLGSEITIPEGVKITLIAPKVSIQNNVAVKTGSELHILSQRRPVNDTSIVDCSNDDTNNLACPVLSHPGQDAEHGRDITHSDDNDGHAGFNFTKICNNGEAAGVPDCPIDPSLGSDPNDWACTKDNVTGLIWEVKTNDGGLRDRDDRYNWYNTDPETNSGDSGYPDDDGNICYGYDSNEPATYCNTQAYTTRINEAGLCGFHDWRVPNREELRSLLDYSIPYSEPTIDGSFFPNAANYNTDWSSSLRLPQIGEEFMVYVLGYGGGWGHTSYKHSEWYVRLVLGWRQK